MSLNKSKGNMYSFVTHTWNPLGGECPHKCSYCSTKKFYYPVLKEKYSGEPKLCKEMLNDNLGKNNFVFVVAQNDLFAKEIPGEWIYSVLAHCDESPDNSYLFQSKNPKRMLDFQWFLPKKSVVCTTIETNRWHPEIMKTAPSPIERAESMILLSERGVKTYITIEPIMDFDLDEMVKIIKWCSPEQVNIGADSGNNNLPEPSKEKVLQLIEELQKFTVIHNKSNLKRLTK